MRVMHVISEMGAGGAESLVAQMCARGPQHDWVSTVVSAGGTRAQEVQAEHGVTTYPMPVAHRRPTGVLRAAGHLRRAVGAADPQVLLAHNVGVTLVARLVLGRRRDRPLVTLFHGVAHEEYPRAVRILRLASDHVVTVSGATAGRLTQAGLPASAVSVIPNAVPVLARPDRADARAALGLGDAPTVLCVARLADQKRHDVLLRAWAEVEPPAVLLLAGDGPLREELQTQARSLRLGERVRFLGARSDVPALLAASDLTVLASDWEGMPMAVLESMAAGVPVVATDVDGVREAVQGAGGTLVPRRDPTALAAALRGLLADPDARRSAARAGTAWVTDQHSPDAMMRSYDQLFRRCLGRTSAGRPSMNGDDL